MDFRSGTMEYFEQLRSDKPLIRMGGPGQYSTARKGSIGSTFIENVALGFTN
jgi:hypothetical protein